MSSALSPIPISPRGRVVSWVSRAIRDGKLMEGSPVPSERTLADQLQVSRVTVKAAYDELTELGLVNQSGAGRMRRVARKLAPSAREAVPSHTLQKTVVLLSSIQTPAWAPPGFDGALQMDLMQRVSDAGYNAMIVNPDTTDGGFIDEGVAGVIIANRQSETAKGRALAERCQEAGLPTVVYGDGPGLEKLDRVTHDHEAGAYELTKLMIERGAKRLLRFWRFPQERGWLQERSRGFERAIAEAGLPLLKPVRCPELEAFGGFRDRSRAFAGFLSEHLLCEEPIDGLMLATDLHALEAAEAIRLLGKKPGEDVLIVGYDNAWPTWQRELPGAEDAPAPLATVDKQLGRVAEQLIATLFEDKKSPDGREAVCRRVAPRVVET